MNITIRLALRSLAREKRSTAFSVCAVMLSSALLVSVGLFLASFLHIYAAEAERETGRYHYSVQNPTESEEEVFCSDAAVGEWGYASVKGYAYFPIPGGELFAAVQARDAGGFSLLTVDLLSGRLPENEHEILISSAMLSYFETEPRVGDTVTLSVCADSTLEGEREAVTMTVSGISELDFPMIFTRLAQGERGESLLLRLRGVGKKYDVMSALLSRAGCSWEDCTPNYEYLYASLEGIPTVFSAAVEAAFTLFSGIVLFAMATVMRNAFSMQLGREMKSLALLRCVGAIPRDIRAVMRKKALVLWGIGLVLGLLLGLAAMAIVFAVVESLHISLFRYLSLTVTVWPFVTTAVLTLVCELLCARGCVSRALRVSPAESAKGGALLSEDRVKAPRAANGHAKKPLFGIGARLAVRNARRNKKRFRSAVRSAVVSMAVFVSLAGIALTLSRTLALSSDAEKADYRVTAALRSTDALSRLQTGLSDCEALERSARYREEVLTLSDGENEGAGVLVTVIGREEYASLVFSGAAPGYDALVASGGAVAATYLPSVSAEEGVSGTQAASWRVGDTVNAYLHMNEKVYLGTVTDSEGNTAEQWESREAARELFSFRVEALLEVPAWFHSPYFAVLYVPRETAETLEFSEEYRTAYTRFYASGGEEALEEAPHVLSDSSFEVLALRAKSGRERELCALTEETIKSLGLSDAVYEHNLYEDRQESEKIVLVCEIFLYGFAAVIALISLVNVCGTVSANIAERERELAMLRVVGMAKGQFLRMLGFECSLYGGLGAVLGGAVGTLLLYALRHTMNGAVTSLPFSPLPLILAGGLVIVLAGFFAGVCTMRSLAKGSR